MGSDTIPQGLVWLQQNARESYPRPAVARVASVIALLTAMFTEAAKDHGYLKVLTAQQYYVFAFSWGLGGDLPPASRSKFGTFVKDLFEFLELPQGMTVFDMAIRPGATESGLQTWTTPSMPQALPEAGQELFVPSPDVDCFTTLFQVMTCPSLLTDSQIIRP